MSPKAHKFKIVVQGSTTGKWCKNLKVCVRVGSLSCQGMLEEDLEPQFVPLYFLALR